MTTLHTNDKRVFFFSLSLLSTSRVRHYFGRLTLFRNVPRRTFRASYWPLGV
jgi:hypothetical protein